MRPLGTKLPGSRPSAEALAREAWARGEPPVRYRLLGGKVGVPDVRRYVRTWVGVVLWLTWPVALARLFGRLGWRRAQHAVERIWARGLVRYLGIRLRIDGLEHVAPGTAYVITPLHEGFADRLALFHLPLDSASPPATSCSSGSCSARSSVTPARSSSAPSAAPGATASSAASSGRSWTVARASSYSPRGASSASRPTF